MARTGRPRAHREIRHARIEWIDPTGIIHLKLDGRADQAEALEDLVSEGAKALSVAKDLLGHVSRREHAIDSTIARATARGNSHEAIARQVRTKHKVVMHRSTISRRIKRAN